MASVRSSVAVEERSTDTTDYLSAFPQLTTLLLSGTAVTDSGLQLLAPLTQLGFLNVVLSKRVTDTGITELQKALPKLKIVR